MGYFAVIAGALTALLTLAKPRFYWESRKAQRMRKLFGDGGTTIVYLIISALLIGIGVLILMGVIELSNN